MAGRRQQSVVEKEERKRIDLKIEVEDFGPISSGEITLKPLTVFIGPNNSGKSYAAMLIHSMLESCGRFARLVHISDLKELLSYFPAVSTVNQLGSMRSILPDYLPSLTRRGFDISLEEIPELKGRVDDSEEGEKLYLDIPKRLMEAVTNMILEEVYQKRLGNEITRSFACPLDELIGIGRGSFALKTSYDSFSIHLICQGDKLKIREYPKDYPQSDIKVAIKGTGKIGHLYSFEYTTLDKKRRMGALITEGGALWKNGSEFGLSQLTELIIQPVSHIRASEMLGDVMMQCHYLPAARSGILQGHKALVANIVRKLPYVGIERLEIPKFSGVVSDFISSIIDLPKEEGPFYQLARHFEKKLIRGEIVVPIPDEYLYPEIKYSFQDTEIPLHRSSSTVSELAPLFLYLKYKVRPNSILVIEEPEAHLHPRNQRVLARLLVRLVREGVNIVITTHSEYLLEQLSNFIMLSKVKPKKREEKYKYTEQDFLEPDEIAAYVFDYDAEAAGHRIGEVEITEEDGISDEEFAKVYEALYDETIKLRRDLSGET